MVTIETTDLVTSAAALLAALAALLTFGVLFAALLRAKAERSERRKDRQSVLMADLSRRWDEPLLAKARAQGARYRNRDALRQAIEQGYQQASDEYFTLLRVPNFFEDLAIQVKGNSVSLEVVRLSFRTTILELWHEWAPSIAFIRERCGSATLYENFEWLKDKLA